MTHRTQLSQAEEHLRRARNTDAARAGLKHVAEHLNKKTDDHDPTDPVTVYSLRATARGWATQTYDWDAERAFRLVWDAMPEPYANETRGEYATRINLGLVAS